MRSLVLLSITFFARRDELWGRFLTCGGLSIRLPPLDAPATTAENRHHSLRLAAMRGSLASCVPVGNRHARRAQRAPPIAAQDAILPHRNRTFPHGHSTSRWGWLVFPRLAR